MQYNPSSYEFCDPYCIVKIRHRSYCYMFSNHMNDVVS